jgi:hypothetical protein
MSVTIFLLLLLLLLLFILFYVFLFLFFWANIIIGHWLIATAISAVNYVTVLIKHNLFMFYIFHPLYIYIYIFSFL